MRVKIVKDENKIEIFINDVEIPNIKSFSFQRDEEEINYMNLNIKALFSDIEFIDKKKD